MNKELQIILDHFFGKSRLDDIPEESIDGLIVKYPYLNVARFLHVKKTGAEKRAEKHPGLFFNNPLWFEFLLQEQEALSETPMQVELVMNRKDVVDTMQEDVPEEIIETRVSELQAIESLETPETSIPGTTVDEIGDHAVENADIPAVLKKEDSFTFEPYHTIDYFASQGIRLQHADLSRDKFGKQLKSFTEWLKSMKRLPDPNKSPIDLEAQEKVVRIAEHSIENKDVYTEAMAEVWAKQGNHRKAIDIYRKLSLINPAKSTYFAAKIEQLNNL